MARGENCLPDERSSSRSKARGLLLGDYRPASVARRNMSREELDRREAELDARRAEAVRQRHLQAWQDAGRRRGFDHFDLNPKGATDKVRFYEAWTSSSLEPEAGADWAEVFYSYPHARRKAPGLVKRAERHDKAGITPEFARPLLRYHWDLSTKQLVGFKALVDEGLLADSDAATLWVNQNFKAEETRKWLAFTDKPDVARRWDHSGFGAEMAARWSEPAGELPELAQAARAYNWTPEQLAAWTAHIRPVYLRPELIGEIDGAGIQADELDGWKAQGYDLDQDPRRASQRNALTDVLRLARLGLSAEQGGELLRRQNQLEGSYVRARSYGRLPEQHLLAWQESGLAVHQAEEFHQQGFGPQEAARWHALGVSAEAAALYAAVGFSPDDKLPGAA